MSNFELRAQELVERVPVVSLWQPWAWLVVHGPKDVENRTWTLPKGMLGKVIHIHASLKEDTWAWTEAQSLCLRNGYDPAQIPSAIKLQYGGIIGRVRVVEYLPPAPSGEPRAPWHMPEQWGWRLAERTPVSFVPMRGYQRFWRVPASVIG